MSIKDDHTYWGTLLPPLDREEQIALFDELNAENTTETRRQTIRETLCLHNLRIVQQQVAKLTKTPDQADDAFSSGVYGLLKAIDACHSGEKAGMFYSYATVWVRGEIVKSLYTAEGMKEKQGMRANQWRRWVKENPKGTPQQAVEEGIFIDLETAEEAMRHGMEKVSMGDLLDSEQQERGVAFVSVTASKDDEQARKHALKEITTLGLDAYELELLLTWSANGCPAKMSNDTRAALEKAQSAAEANGTQMRLFE